MLFECFLAFFGPKNAKKHSKSTLWGTPRQVPKIAQKALRGALSGPGPKSTPVNGGRDLEDRNLLKLRRLDPSCPFFLSDNSIWGQRTQMLQML